MLSIDEIVDCILIAKSGCVSENADVIQDAINKEINDYYAAHSQTSLIRRIAFDCSRRFRTDNPTRRQVIAIVKNLPNPTG